MTEKIHSTSSNTTERSPSPGNSIAEKLIDMSTKSWWSRLDDLDGDFGEGFFAKNTPLEQLIVGHNDINIRFFNFGDKQMSDEKIADCERFVDTITQLFGDRAYDYVTDVVIAPMSKAGEDSESGRVYRNFEGVLFIDSNLLEHQGAKFDGNENQLDVSKFLYVLTHEFGHALDGNGYENTEALLEYAKKAGWDVDSLQLNSPLWSIGIGEAFKSSPEHGVIIRHENGTTEEMAQDAYLDQYGQPHDEHGKLLKNIQLTGSPTDYAEKNPKESYAETTTDMLLGSFVMNHMPEVRDAWLDHIGSRGELAAPIKRVPIATVRNKGSSIIYPTL